MERVRKCVICGNIFVGRPNKKYCCSECRRKAQTEKKAKECKKPKEIETKKPKRKLGSLSLEQINKRARAEGLTYGQYVAKYS